MTDAFDETTMTKRQIPSEISISCRFHYQISVNSSNGKLAFFVFFFFFSPRQLHLSIASRNIARGTYLAMRVYYILSAYDKESHESGSGAEEVNKRRRTAAKFRIPDDAGRLFINYA